MEKEEDNLRVINYKELITMFLSVFQDTLSAIIYFHLCKYRTKSRL